MEKTKSLFIDYNNTDNISHGEDGKPLNGMFVHAESYDDGKKVILRFRNGMLDGDVFDKNGNLMMQKPAVEAEGHQEYWRANKLHRDNDEPAVYSEGFKIKEYWVNGERIEK